MTLPLVSHRIVPGTVQSRVYPLYLEKTKAMEKHVEEALWQGLDLQTAYNPVRVQADDEWENVFSTTSGHYEYLVMAYGLVNAP